jgi:hypothetical protein
MEKPFERLLQAQTLKCTFDNFNGANFFYDSIDLKYGTARVIGNMGAGGLIVVAGVYGLTFIERFIERFPSGLSITTVFADCKQGTRKLIAVLSRHVALFGSPIPSQFYGTCVVWQLWSLRHTE